jgi:hypothetical protein
VPLQAIDLGRHHEVVEVEAADGMGGQRDLGMAPAEGDVGMVVLGLGDGRDADHEIQGLGIGGEG